MSAEQDWHHLVNDVASALAADRESPAPALARDADRSVLEYGAIWCLNKQAHLRLRSRAVSAERAATARRNGRTLEQQRAEENRQSEEFMANGGLMPALQAALDDYKRKVRMEWTRELLDTWVTLDDGSRSTWGDLSIVEHEQRKRMFMSNAENNMEGAARHQLAIDALKDSGSYRLNDMVAAA